MKLSTHNQSMLADTLTPVSIYLRLRDKYANSILLESSDYHSQENSLSYICCQLLATFRLERGWVYRNYNGVDEEPEKVADNVVDQPTGV